MEKKTGDKSCDVALFTFEAVHRRYDCSTEYKEGFIAYDTSYNLPCCMGEVWDILVRCWAKYKPMNLYKRGYG